MKKIISIVVTVFTVLGCSLSSNAEQGLQELSEEALTSQVEKNYDDEKAILRVCDQELTSVKDFSDIKGFMNGGGIVLIDNTMNSQEAERAAEYLGMTVQPSCISDEESDEIVDVATFYYYYGNGLSGIYIISAQRDIGESEKNSIITETVDEIRLMQESNHSGMSYAVSASSSRSLGIVNVATVYRPRGKLIASYEFFTVQEYNGQDYYIVKAKINGQPGCILADSDANFESKYQGKGMNVDISTDSTSVSTDSYGPHRTVKGSSYAVSVGGSFQDGLPGFAANFNYSRSIDDTDIEASLTSRQVSWEVDLKSKAQERSCDFEPAVTFRCPSTKTSVDFSVFTSYDLDAWNTLTKTISVSRRIRCTPSNCSEI